MKRSRIPLLLLPPAAAILLALALSLLAPRTGSAAGHLLPAPDGHVVYTSTAVPPDAHAVFSATAPPLKDAGLTIIATAPVVTAALNTTFLILNQPGALPMRDARLSLDFWSGGVLVRHLPFTPTAQPGPNVFPLTWTTTAFSPTYDARADNFLVAQWFAADGHTVDTAQRSLQSFGADPLPAVALSDSLWDIGTITQGVVLDRAFTVANLGTADLALYLSGAGASQSYHRLAPGDMAAYTVTLDTLALSPSPFSHTLTMRTSDPATPVRTILISGTLVAPDMPAAVFAVPDRPWDRRVVVFGSVAENTPVYFSDFNAPDAAVSEPCTVSDASGLSLKGVSRICLDTDGSAFAGANGWRVLVERLDGPLMRFSVPEEISGGAAYIMRFGKLYTFGEGGAALSVPLRIISQTLATASMDVLVANVGLWGPLNVQVTAGNQTIYSQTQVITQPTVIRLPDFAGALNQYLAAQPPGSTAGVPFQLSLDSAADVVLTNFSLVPARSIDLSIGPGDVVFGPPVTSHTLTEGLSAPITATVRNAGATDSGPLVVSFYRSPAQAAELLPQYIRSALISNVPAGSSALAVIVWDTTGVTQAVSVTAVADPFNRLPESSKANNSADGALSILARPALEVIRIEPADAHPVTNEVIPTSVVLRNSGQTDALSLTVALYEGDPSSNVDLFSPQAAAQPPTGTVLMDSYSVRVAAGAELTATLTWIPLRAGARRLIAAVSASGATPPPAGPNRQAVLPVFVGFRGPILIDSGGPNDGAYTPTAGYGFLGADGGVSSTCGAESYRTMRQGANGPLQYRVDNFQPGRAYHLDLIFGECDGAGRQQRVLVNGKQVLGAVDLSDEQPHRFSMRLDPALYAGNVITLTVDDVNGRPALLSEIHVYDVDYRAIVAGSPAEQPYPVGSAPALAGRRSFGYLNGTPLSFDAAPGPTMRAMTVAGELSYRFDRLDPAQRYALNLTFYHRFELTPTLAVALGSWYHSPEFTVPYSQPYAVNIAIPRGAYASDGSLTVSISRTDIVSGSFVNELALEEQTLGETLSSADLMLLSLESPRSITAGVPVTYTLLVINNGPDPASDVVLNAASLFPGLRLVGSASGGYCDVAVPLSCSLGAFPSGTSAAVSIVLTPTAAGVLNIPVSIDSATTDPNSANNGVLLSSRVFPGASP